MQYDRVGYYVSHKAASCVQFPFHNSCAAEQVVLSALDGRVWSTRKGPVREALTFNIHLEELCFDVPRANSQNSDPKCAEV